METDGFGSLAHIRIPLIPVGLVPKPTFELYAAELRSFTTLRLIDIPSETKDGKAARFLPNPLSSGHLHVNFPSHPPPRSHAPLSLVRPSHFPLAVIGIATCSQTDFLNSIFHQFNTTLSDLFPPGSTFPLVRNCFVFEGSEGSLNLNPGESLPGLIVVPQIANRKLHIGTLLGVLCSQVLTELGVLVQAMESPIGNEYLNAALMPSLPPLSELPSPLNIPKSDPAIGLPSHSSQPEISRSSFTLNAAPVLRRNASTAATVNRHTNLTVQAQKKRISTIGTSSSPGRMFKMLGDFFLLAGRWEDALIWYNEAAQVFRNSHDSLWFACTCEGMATAAIIEAWSTQNTSTSVKDPWSDVNDKLQQAITLYQRTPTPDGEQIHSLLAFLFCNCVLRQASLFFAVWSAEGWGPLAFTAMLQPGWEPNIPLTLASDGDSERSGLERLTLLTGISRSTISGILGQLHGPWLLHLGQRERIAVLETTASLYACLGYQRKEAYILREVLGCLLDLIVCGREEDGYSQTPSIPQSAGLGIHNVHPVPGTNPGSVGVRLSESVAGNEGILRLLSHICRVLGINLKSVGLFESAETRAIEHPSLDDYDEDIIQELKEPLGWPELQVGVVREAVAVAEALPDFPAVAQYSLSALKTLQMILTPGDQYHLYSTATRALMTARRRGDSRSAEYWSGRPIISISVAPLPGIRVPLERPRSIQQKVSNPPPILRDIVDPFLYNPRKVTDKGQILAVQNEVLEFVIMLQNPYIFDLELQQLSLSTTGVPFVSQPVRVTIPAGALHQVVIAGTATETGTLVLRGCFVQAPGGIAREYILPLHTNEEDNRLARKRRSILSENGRFKYSGLERFPWSKAQKHSNMHSSQSPSFKFLECKIIPEQPLLRIRRTSVTHGALMLYDGERSTIRITLENTSTIPIDFLHLSFDDSTVELAQKSLQEGQLSVFETYETEYSLIHRPVLSWDKGEAKTILSYQNLTLTLGCFGKVGCTNGTINISYAYSRDPKVDGSDVFYIRQVSYPLVVTVYHMLECSGMDLLPFPNYPNLRSRRDESFKDEKFRHLDVSDDSGWCLFSVEVRNSYGTPFDVVLSRTQDGDANATSTTTIPPGSVSRLIIPIKKIVLDEDIVCKPIPTLYEKQFVVATSSLSKVEERAQRELFWHREELFKCVSARWHETGGTRSGELSFRTQRLSLPMLETLRLEIARVSFYLELDESDTDQIGYAGARQCARPNEFIELKAKVTNLAKIPIVFTLDIEVSPAEYLVYEGVLTDLPLGRLKTGESKEFKVFLCFLSCGRFEISGQVRGVGPEAEGRVARTHMTAMVTEGQ